MPSWTSAYSIRRRHGKALLLLGPLWILAFQGGITVSYAEPWRWRPWITFSTGYENDRILDLNLDRLAVPGGNFLDLTPGMTLSGRLSGRARFRLTGQGTLERFLNSESRSLYGAALTGDLRVPLNGPWQWRVALGGNYFADSEREAVNRLGGGLEAALRYASSRWYLELLGGIEGRRYENLIVADDAGILDAYTEGSPFLGGGGSVRVARRLVLSGSVTRHRTEARDRLYDATAWSAEGAARMRVAGGTWLTVSGLGQRRSFDSRQPFEDSDSYWQLGAGLERRITGGMSFTARYAYARYVESAGGTENIHRLSSGFTWSIGRLFSEPVSIDPSRPAEGEPPPLRENDTHRFKFYAPEAKHVALVADFNSWDPSAHPLRAAGDGWWELELSLPAGSHQYAYVVDGEMVPPPEAELTIDDGFGGRNGLLRVLPNGP